MVTRSCISRLGWVGVYWHAHTILPFSSVKWCWVWPVGSHLLVGNQKSETGRGGWKILLCYCSDRPQDGPVHPPRQAANLSGTQQVTVKPWDISDSFFSCVSSVGSLKWIHSQHSSVFSVLFKQITGPKACVPSEGQSCTGNQANYWVEPLSCRGNYL